MCVLDRAWPRRVCCASPTRAPSACLVPSARNTHTRITPPLASKKSSRWARRGARLQGPPQRAREHLVDSEAAERIDQTASADLMTDDAGGARCALHILAAGAHAPRLAEWPARRHVLTGVSRAPPFAARWVAVSPSPTSHGIGAVTQDHGLTWTQ